MKRLYILIVIYISCLSNSEAQKIRINFDKISSLDDDGFHITILYKKPIENLVLPDIDTTGALFFDLFYSWDIDDDEIISIMVIKEVENDFLYADLNNDEDLTNDISPIKFSTDKNEITLEINYKHDPLQVTRYSLLRTPKIPDSSKNMFFKEDGSLNKRFLELMKSSSDHYSDLNSDKGMLYFDYRITLKYTYFPFENNTIKLGLFDYNNNGIYLDNKDWLMVDLNKDSILTSINTLEVFLLNDIFRIGNQNYKVLNTDKYGNWIELQKTEEKETNYYIRELNETYAENLNVHGQKMELENNLWKKSFININNDSISLKNYSGKYLLLNFWGDWCLPCISEIPDLIKARKTITNNKFEIISFLYTQNLNRAKEVIKKYQMDWNQILLEDQIKEKFKIIQFPTNILIFPDGKSALRFSQIKYDLLQKIITN
ncbi:TlpA family protein disulfide reductase [Bacteroidota bacterium]